MEVKVLKIKMVLNKNKFSFFSYGVSYRTMSEIYLNILWAYYSYNN